MVRGVPGILTPQMADASAMMKQAEQHLKRGEREQARLVLQRALQKAPNDPFVLSSMAFVLQELGQHDQAMSFGKRALASRPNDIRFIENLANIFGLCKHHAEAAEVFERVVTAEPLNANAWSTLAAAYFFAGRLAESKGAALRGLAIHPMHPRLIEHQSGVERKLGACDEAYAIVKAGSLANPDDTDLAQETAFNSNYPSNLEPEEVLDAHKRFGTLWCSKVKRIALPPPSRAEADRRLRVAFMSPDFRLHSVAHYAEPVIAGLDRSQFDVFIYFLHPKPDAVTERFRKLIVPERWCDGVRMSDDVLAQRIAFDRIDILIDLTGLTGGARPGVLARKPAPIQVNYLGYPNTIGMTAVDCRFIDSITDPPGPADSLAVERLVRLDPCFLCYRPSADAPEVSAAPMLKNGFVTFGSFNAGMKVSEACVSMWAAALRAVPGSRLFLKNFDFALPEPREHLFARFAAREIERDRVGMMAFADTIAEHLGLYHRVDIGLDTYPYHGTTTTCEAFHMGIPVVTREGDVHAARVGSTLLSAVGLPELIARNDEEFVRIAAGLAADPARVSALRASMRDRQAKGVLGDEAAFAERFGAALRRVWRDSCATGG